MTSKYVRLMVSIFIIVFYKVQTLSGLNFFSVPAVFLIKTQILRSYFSGCIQSWNFSVPGRNFPVPSRDRILKLGPGPAVPGPNLNFPSRDGTRPVPPSRPVPKHKIFRNYIFKSMVDPSTRVLWNRSGYANYVLRLSAAILNTDFKKD